MESGSKKLSTKKSVHKLHHRGSEQEGTLNKHGNTDRPRCRSGLSKKTVTRPKLQTNCNQNEMNALLKESYNYLKDENQVLSQQLRKKGKKIQEMKETLKVYETKMSCFEETIALLKDRGLKQTEETLACSRKKYEEMIKESQDIAKQSIEKYRKIQKQMQEQKQHYQRQIALLKEENIKLAQPLFDPNSQTPLEKGTERTTDNKKKKSHSSHKQVNNILQDQLIVYKARQQEWIRKERHMRKMLSEISDKVDSYESKCRASEDKSRACKIELQELRHRHKFQLEEWKQKYKKAKDSNDQWSSLFSELMKETVGTKKEIDDVKKMLVKLIRKETKELTKP